MFGDIKTDTLLHEVRTQINDYMEGDRNKPRWFSGNILQEEEKTSHFDHANSDNNNLQFYPSEKVIQPIMNSLDRFSLVTSHLQDVKRKFISRDPSLRNNKDLGNYAYF